MKHKIDWGPGIRFFHCEECNLDFQYPTRHCESPSKDFCPRCCEDCEPLSFERHYEWETDKSGNLRNYSNQ